MGCYLENHGARVGTWGARTSWGTTATWRNSQGNDEWCIVWGNDCMYSDFYCATGIWWAAGTSWSWCGDWEDFCSGCGRNLKSGTRCNTRDAGSIAAGAMLEMKWWIKGKWICHKCRSERLRLVEETLQIALRQIDGLRRENSWQQTVGKLTCGVRCRVFVKVESA